jgi:hypothetical protein
VGLDAEHRTLVGRFPTFRSRKPLSRSCFLGFRWNPTSPLAFLNHVKNALEEIMGRGILLWLLGVPIPVIILLWLFFGR